MNQARHIDEPVGRYVLHQAIARGGMATVHAARLRAAEGVTRLVAAKRLHPHFTDDPEFVTMFHDEARIASRIHHPNVVPVLDVVVEGNEVILVQEYVHGVPLSWLLKRALVTREPIPSPIVVAIITGILAGLHAAHEATDDFGEPLGVVHRDVSPQNVLVSSAGLPRLLDFGIAKAKGSMHHTRTGFLKGKLSYMSPEQLRADPVTRLADVYAAGVVLWELIVNKRFYDGRNDADFVRTVALGSIPTPTQALKEQRAKLGPARWDEIVRLEPIVMRALSTSPEARYPTAAAMAAAILDAAPAASQASLAEWVRDEGADYLDRRQRILQDVRDRSLEEMEAGPPSGDRVRLSGARIRLDTVNVSEVSMPTPPSIQIPLESTLMMASGIVRQRSVLPWTLVAVLLVVVGVLMGMVIVRESSAPAATPAPPPPVVSAPVATHAEPPPTPPPPTTTQPQPTSRPARSAKGSRAATSSTNTPAAAPKADCNPPFYFDGTKKVFKPACI